MNIAPTGYMAFNTLMTCAVVAILVVLSVTDEGVIALVVVSLLVLLISIPEGGLLFISLAPNISVHTSLLTALLITAVL